MLIETAYAQAAAGPMAQGSPIGTIFPLLVMIGVFYMFVMRPQMKREREKRQMHDGLRRGDKIITLGGIVAEIVKVEDDHYLEVAIAPGTNVRLAKASVEGVVTKGIPAAPVAEKAATANGKKPTPKTKQAAKKAKK